MLTWTTALFLRNIFIDPFSLTILIFNAISYSNYLIHRIVNENIVIDANEDYGAEDDYATLQV